MRHPDITSIVFTMVGCFLLGIGCIGYALDYLSKRNLVRIVQRYDKYRIQVRHLIFFWGTVGKESWFTGDWEVTEYTKLEDAQEVAIRMQRHLKLPKKKVIQEL